MQARIMQASMHLPHQNAIKALQKKNIIYVFWAHENI